MFIRESSTRTSSLRWRHIGRISLLRRRKLTPRRSFYLRGKIFAIFCMHGQKQWTRNCSETDACRAVRDRLCYVRSHQVECVTGIGRPFFVAVRTGGPLRVSRDINRASPMRGDANYIRPRVTGARIFFTIALADRGSDLLVREVARLRETVRETRAERPFGIDAWVLLPDHLHAMWTPPEGDAEFSTRWARSRRGSAEACVGRGSPRRPSAGRMAG